ncbi:MAG: HAD-IB family phosphatase [Candidatus Krumholzibacteria bacterium]
MKLEKAFDLICFDVDGTLVKHPTGMVIWEVLNIRFGGSVGQNRKRYAMYRDGKISYAEWVELDIEDWLAAGASRETILESVSEFDLVDGARDTVTELALRGFKLGVISGTLDIVLDTLFPDHPFGDVYTNKIYFDKEGQLSAYEATPYDGRGKPDALRAMAEKHGVPLARCAFVGDGENDVPLLGVPGCFVAYRPKSPKLAAGADIVIQEEGLRSLLDVFR